MIEQFNFDIRLIFAILNGKVSAAINRKLSRNFRQNGLEITPEQWTVLIFLWEKDGVTQQELCNATFKDKPSMTRLIDNMERQHLVVDSVFFHKEWFGNILLLLTSLVII